MYYVVLPVHLWDILNHLTLTVVLQNMKSNFHIHIYSYSLVLTTNVQFLIQQSYFIQFQRIGVIHLAYT